MTSPTRRIIGAAADMTHLFLVATLVAVLTAPGALAMSPPPRNASGTGSPAAATAAKVAVEPPPPPGHIMVRPPVRQVEEPAPAPAGPGPQPLAVRPAPAAVGPGPGLGSPPGTIVFPNDRLSDPQDRGVNVWDYDSLVDGCGSLKNCLGFPANCEEAGSCKAIVTVQVIDDKFIFRMRATDAVWVAVGLGDSNAMYGTSVIECVQEASTQSPVQTYLSYTPTDKRGCERMDAGKQSALTLQGGQTMDGGLFCEVFRVNRTNDIHGDYDLTNTPYFLQLAFGSALKTDGSGVGYHHNNRVAAARSVYLWQYESVAASSNWPLRLHGALMVLAWMFAATAGSLAARYFKAAWGKATICGKAMWFAWHRLLMVVTVVLHVTAVIAALIFLKGWSSSSGVHGILGGVTTGLALLQGAGGLLRPSPDDKYRPVFNWVHRCQGFLTHILAVITIFLAVPAAGLPSYSYIILGVYVAFYVALHAVHSLTEVKSYYFLVIIFGSAVFAIAMLVIVVIGASGSS